MPHLTISQEALSGIRRCRTFLLARNPRAADAASQAIKRKIAVLRSQPEIGRLVADRPGLRELIIDFGASGYVARYRFDATADRVVVTGFRYQHEFDD
ncbi:hypothetical protein IP69_01235 [Bosea sp. AAP35]|uniref:type II toxin-antitoxin system RelE/ParE family toxin n=1 Tax=Bosea sp. AAP35 TaxID=1523417 RepID=UPI0006CC3AF9|nr:type II toxin-antitoxin system RelE/ParE family toxin [Bosea sp. AAP35]KPF72556.1 hypothetical protein IP69_01235 [Bosea sp. AAP35]